MIAVNYDFSSLRELLFKVEDAQSVCDDLKQLVFNYIRNLDGDFADSFKSDMVLIERLLKVFEVLADQERTAMCEVRCDEARRSFGRQ